MKKLVLTALTIVGFTLNANAQEIRYGVTAGVHSTVVTLSGDDSFGFAAGSEGGFFLGGLAEVTFSDFVRVQPELLYVFGDQNTSALYLPINAKIYTNDAFYFQVGPQLNYFLDLDDNAVGFDINGGLGYEYNEQWGIQFRYGWSLSDRDNSDLTTTKLHSYQFGLSYRFF